MEDSQDTHSLSLQTQLCRRFSFSEIQKATHEFDEGLIIGRGGFGNVYKGSIKIGDTYVVAAIKRLHSNSNQGATEFWAEVDMLSKLRHCNLASLIGYCDDEKEMILLYEYMPQGTLEGCLYKSGRLLSWVQRLEICIGAARGLDYLHTGSGTKHGVIHRDVKSSNILLDENFAAKISDFGLARIGPTNQTHTSVTTGVKGTFGYMDPRYFYTNKLTRKTDVYAFGVVLFEVLCGRPAVDTSLDEEQWGLASWAQDRIREGKLLRIVDISIREQILIDSLKEFARVAVLCLHTRPNQRPTMAELVAKLEYALSLQKGIAPSATKINNHINDGVKKVHSKPVGSVGSAVEAGSESGGELVRFDGGFEITLTELLTSSAKFLSENPFWRTYVTFLPNGSLVVVKRILTRLNQKKFVRTISVLGKIRHPNVLDLKAYYWGRGESLCVFKFMPNGSLASLIQSASQNSCGSIPAFHWPLRINIIMSITRGLFYLHNQERIVHGDLKSNMIMLDENNNPKISNVGLSWLMPATSRRFRNNCAPEFTGSANATEEIDVFSLGIIMLEVLTGESTYKRIHPVDLPTWVKSIPKERWSAEVLDKNLVDENPNKSNAFVQLMKLAIHCVEYDPKARPRVEDVLQTLEQIEVDRSSC